MAAKISSLKRSIMWRVYYAYALRIGTHPLVTHSVLIVGAVFALTYFVSFPHIVENVMQVKVGEVGAYFVGALLHTELWTVVLLALTLAASVSLILRLRRMEPVRFDDDMAFIR
jgi:hypothetical protein